MPIEEAVAVADNAHDHVQSTGPGREIIDLTQGLMRLPWRSQPTAYEEQKSIERALGELRLPARG